ncbi:MAG: methionyl-tRNA formyltransferase [Anaerolineae bacterium CFX3]|jgi:methionyl-tRNA formyltransferase|nr:methionyl-tRNA formyltransferase [Anaerolineae bacterium]MCE7904334.1 methionyl-tRNA formyltransferase [Anaerolineae bacterium CFX3]MCQ3946148.1 methionyl-tRNA formyltransferase [Anaerolineae bacterium]MDX9936108.1 methionyl-tRNA formyltransferase [Anaerolineales bacterium]RIK27567.1 MAG: methionyl-tRNA formyltransferase [Anaerolineae bacterium]
MSHRVVFMGSPDFALPGLRALASRYQIVGVVTQPDRASGRGRALKPPPVKTLALELGLPLVQPEKLRQPEAVQQLRAWNPDLIVVAAFGQILKPEVLDLPRFGCLNVHASLLPRWRGAAPINAAILAGDEETGVTIMKMDAGLDTGGILAQRAFRLSPDVTAGAAFDALSALGADLLLESLPDYLAGKLTPVPQPEDGVTYAPMLKKEDGRLDFARPADELERRVRAMNPWPGAWFEWDANLLKVARAKTLGGEKGRASGIRLVVEGRPAVTCADGALVLEEVQPAGKRPMSGRAFLAGARGWESR